MTMRKVFSSVMKKVGEAVPNQKLIQERLQRHLTQEELAERIGTNSISISRWERGIAFPSAYLRQKLREFYGKSDGELGLLKDRGQEGLLPENPLPIWNVPYQHNPSFTGREDILAHLHEILDKNKVGTLTQPQAMTGLGGIGKTQTAVEYAYRYYRQYEAVLWVQADTRDAFLSEFANIAYILKLTPEEETDQNHLVNAVKRWLQEHKSWLLVIDNIEDLTLVRDFTPSLRQGHILLTTRTQYTGAIAQNVEINKLKEEEGALLLLRRTNIVAVDARLDNAPNAEIELARQIALVMDGLPLALEQAGAYIAATGCSLVGYLERYQKHRAELLGWRDKLNLDYPESVATTWSLSFRRVEQASPAAADLLRLCAFLYPEAIPEEIVTEGSRDLGPSLKAITDDFELDQIIGELFKYSLVRRNLSDRTLNIHRLVQVVLKDAMDEHTQRLWAERAVRATNSAFPSDEELPLSARQRFIPHAQVCEAMIKEWKLTFLEAAQLLYKAGNYLRENGRYTQAEPLCLSSLGLLEEVLGTENLYVCNTLTNLAIINESQGKLAEAESLYKRTLATCEETFGPQHPDTATCLNHLGLLYIKEGKFTQAEPLIQRALTIRKNVLGMRHPQVAHSLMALAELRSKRVEHAQAESLYLEALAIREQALGPAHPGVASVLKNLAACYASQGQLTQAEQRCQRALEIYTKAFGTEHREVALTLSNLAAIHFMQEKYAQAEELCERALKIFEQDLEAAHPEVVKTRDFLAETYKRQRKFLDAEALFQSALAAIEGNLGTEHPEVAATLTRLAAIYMEQEKYTEADPLYRRSLAIAEKVLGQKDIKTVIAVNNLAALYLKQRRYYQAEVLFMRVLPICIQTFKMVPPATFAVLENYIRLLEETGRGHEAADLTKRANQIRSVP
jgi:tetratricopeptide (TPR) repeat protein